MPLKITADDPSPALHQEQARKRTNMDAVRYSRAADDACTEITLLASYTHSLILLIDNLQRDANRFKEKFDAELSERVVLQ